MILTGSVLLLAFVGAVRPYPFGNQQPSGSPNFGYNQQLSLQQSPPFQSAAAAVATAPVQQQYTNNQDSLNKFQLNNNAQRFYQHQQQLLQNPRFFAGVQQQHPIQQLQVPSAPNRAIQQNQFYAGQPTMHNLQARLEQTTGLPTKAAAPADNNFLSTLQIIDTQGRLRELKDFGLGGSGNHPEEPELERQLKNIFETINRDLENAAFLPLDMNSGSHQQFSNIFQTNQYNSRGAAQSDRSVKRLPQESEERPRLPQAVDPRAYLHQQQQHHHQQQQQQHLLQQTLPQKQHQQFQFLQPARTNKAPEAPIRSPAQTLRDAKNLQEKKQEEQRPIEQVPLKQEQLPVKGSARIEQQQVLQQQIQQQPIKQQQQPVQLPLQQQQQLEDSKYQNSYKAPAPIQQQREITADTKTRQPQHQEPLRPVEQVKQRDPINQYQGPIEQQITLPATQPERKPTIQFEPQQQQQQQQLTQGFDDEPAALKTVEREQPQAKEARQRPVDAFKPSFRPREKATIEQPSFDPMPISQAPIQQKQIEEIQQQQQPLPLPPTPIEQQPLQQQQLKQDAIEEDEPIAPGPRWRLKRR